MTLFYANGLTQELDIEWKVAPVNQIYIDQKSGKEWLRLFIREGLEWRACMRHEKNGFIACPFDHMAYLPQLTGEVLRYEFLLKTNNIGDLL